MKVKSEKVFTLFESSPKEVKTFNVLTKNTANETEMKNIMNMTDEFIPLIHPDLKW